MNERRSSFRHLVYLNVRLYHDEFGQINGKITDVSSGGMLVKIDNADSFHNKLSREKLRVKPINMDVIFDMECLRVDSQVISLQFI
ncbi:hypothetical protein MNBD_GAMMA23-585 [hydrothermal vent metagenome]|uniref:PilZ domain-containing protein n=1 Tax=hydrothermal vent metagenome TaxID=652676 RepID=A0A3B1A7Y0_9ZZZZ